MNLDDFKVVPVGNIPNQGRRSVFGSGWAGKKRLITFAHAVGM